MTLECHTDSYVEPGASVDDDCDANVAVVIGGDVVDVDTLGTYVVTYDATDASGNPATRQPGNPATQVTRTVEVVDTAAPVVTPSVHTDVLWSPDHHMVDVGLAVDVSDACDSAPSLTVEVWSDETEIPDTGDGTGRHAPDYKTLLDSGQEGTFLRSERRGGENGRVYLIVARVLDESGNVSFGFTTVVVPHDQSEEDLDVVAAQAAADVLTIEAPDYPPGTTIADVVAPLVAQGWTQHNLSAPLGPHQ